MREHNIKYRSRALLFAAGLWVAALGMGISWQKLHPGTGGPDIPMMLVGLASGVVGGCVLMLFGTLTQDRSTPASVLVMLVYAGTSLHRAAHDAGRPGFSLAVTFLVMAVSATVATLYVRAAERRAGIR